MKEEVDELINKINELLNKLKESISIPDIKNQIEHLKAINSTIFRLERKNITVPQEFRNIKLNLLNEIEAVKGPQSILSHLREQLLQVLKEIDDTLKIKRKRIRTKPSKKFKDDSLILQNVLEVVTMVYSGHDLTSVLKKVAKEKGVSSGTIRHDCTKRINFNSMYEFRNYLDNKEQLIEHLCERFPNLAEKIKEEFKNI